MQQRRSKAAALADTMPAAGEVLSWLLLWTSKEVTRLPAGTGEFKIFSLQIFSLDRKSRALRFPSGRGLFQFRQALLQGLFLFPPGGDIPQDRHETEQAAVFILNH